MTPQKIPRPLFLYYLFFGGIQVSGQPRPPASSLGIYGMKGFCMPPRFKNGSTMKLIPSETRVHRLISSQSKFRTFDHSTRTWSIPGWKLHVGLLRPVFQSAALNGTFLCFLDEIQPGDDIEITDTEQVCIVEATIYLYSPVFQFPEVEQWADVNQPFVCYSFTLCVAWKSFISPQLQSSGITLYISVCWVTVRGIESRQPFRSWSNKQCGLHWGVSLSPFILHIKRIF